MADVGLVLYRPSAADGLYERSS